MSMLQQTSRTFYIPISRLVPGLKEAVASAYLCMRAIDEIEDDPALPDTVKINLLRDLSAAFRSPHPIPEIGNVLKPYKDLLPNVTLELADWVLLCPATIQSTVQRYIADMSEQMADWVQAEWKIHTEEDLDRYTYSVAGMVGEMLSELWHWHDHTESDRSKAIAFGRGLQAVNILRNRGEDQRRGVNFFPKGWGHQEMLRYTQRNLKVADEYLSELKPGPALQFCKIPLALAHATVRLIALGGKKLTRADVHEIVESTER
jgi:farnesyl-diphosphate farnesyltransferase